MEQRVNMLTFAVESVPKSRAFYQSLGWKVGKHSETDDVCFFQAGTTTICLYTRASFDKDFAPADATAATAATAAPSVPSSTGAADDGEAAAPPTKRARVHEAITEAPLVTVCYLARSREEVSQIADKFVDAGGRIVKRALETNWGGFSAFVADIDGVVWEITVAMGPFSIDERGFADLTLPADSNGTDTDHKAEDHKAEDDKSN